MGLSVVCVILVSHHILKGCYYITFHYLYDKTFEKKRPSENEAWFSEAFSLYVGLNKNGTIFLCRVWVRQKVMADCLLSLKALLGFGGFSASGLGNQI